MLQVSPLQPGATAPDFDYTDTAGHQQNTQSLRGTTFIVYFYPKDDTPGCTKEACGFRDTFKSFTERGITIIGVSADSQKSHLKFQEKYSLPFPLASDPDNSICRAFGAFGEKQFMGKTYEGIHRMTFVVGPDGKILKTYEKVKPEAHAETLLADLAS